MADKVKNVYDITPPITSRLCVWSGDTSFSSETLCHLNQGGSVTLTTIHTTVHLGAHADAPMHYQNIGETIGERDISYYIGDCQVIHVEIQRGKFITPEDIKGVEILAERILFATNTFNENNWNDNFVALSPELVEELSSKGVILVGIDTPSVDLMNSKDLPVHKAILAKDMAILEGLLLRDVPEGKYELIALPLKLMGVDASPVRAILRKL
ncbi:cyclase family protein [Alkaliphilus serpentinus]|uniref:Kynurenine formamidase n=1 Tax=Alkaliphilus serpentinus TaxID=1482731 RepID=A0A833M817_9FIRM|nr:cyclase family protein [Alkaliphilus serpentinus]KAB3531592.1 hypothetical protein F8153_05305 [Alkaliphilus serpentinus]